MANGTPPHSLLPRRRRITAISHAPPQRLGSASLAAQPADQGPQAEIGAALFRRVAHGAGNSPRLGRPSWQWFRKCRRSPSKRRMLPAERPGVRWVHCVLALPLPPPSPGGALCHPRVSTRLPGRSLVTSGVQHGPLGAGIRLTARWTRPSFVPMTQGVTGCSCVTSRRSE